MARVVAIGVACCFAVVLMSGCMVAPVVPPAGGIYNDWKAPLNYEQQGNQFGLKTGTASTGSILGLVAWGDGSIRAAAANGGITKVNNADYEYFNVIGIYQRYTTIVYGE